MGFPVGSGMGILEGDLRTGDFVGAVVDGTTGRLLVVGFSVVLTEGVAVGPAGETPSGLLEGITTGNPDGASEGSLGDMVG